jgi:predicted unusual protein kinase regulating ubiquinone biosynthesis (AarF/ABC1/UbiB family)
MNADLQQLLAAFPRDDADDGALPRALVTQRAIPTGRLARLWTLGTMQAQIAIAYGAMWMRSLLGGAQEDLVETHLAAAAKLVGGMLYLRGAVMKVGQAMAAYPNLVPEEIAATLDCLHFDAPPMHFSLVREHLENELDRSIAEAFAEFDERAFAAASLGQVHRARLRSGELVAVKIQYPGIAATIDSDLRNLATVIAPLRFTRDWENITAQLEDIRAVLSAEVDYLAEADNIERAQSLFAHEDGIVIPRVFRDYSTSRVLTMELLGGQHVDAWLSRNPSQSERDAFGSKIYTAAFRFYYAGRSDYADPHPGNYFFLEDGRLGVVDFGCVRGYTDEEWALLSDIDQSFYLGRQAARDAMVRYCDLSPSESRDEKRMALLEESYRWSVEPLLQPLFDFGDPEHMRMGIDIMARAVACRYTRAHPMQIYLSRTLLGLRSLLLRMRARVPVRAIHEAELRQSGWPWVNDWVNP